MASVATAQLPASAPNFLRTSTDSRPIAIVAARYPPAIGGVELHVQRLAEGLAARGIPVEVLVTDPTGELRPFERRDGIPVRRFPTLRRGDEVYFVSARLLRWVWRHADRYRLLHAHGYHTPRPLIPGPGARRPALPLVVTPPSHARGHTRFRTLPHLPYRPIGGWA